MTSVQTCDNCQLVTKCVELSKGNMEHITAVVTWNQLIFKRVKNHFTKFLLALVFNCHLSIYRLC